MIIIDFEEQPEFDFSPNSVEEEIVQNIRFLCMTIEGSLPLDRAFGLNRDFLDKPINEARLILIPEIISKVDKYEPRASVIKVDYNGQNAESGKMRLKLFLGVNTDER